MEKQAAFNCATYAYAGLHAYTDAVMQIMGEEKAREIDTIVFEKLGAAQGQMLRQEVGLEGDADIQTAYKLLGSLIATIGIETEITESSPNKIVMKVSACPVYTAAAMVGWEPAKIEAGCKAGSMAFTDAAVKQLNPRLSVHLGEFRGTPERCCFEEIVLE